MSEPSMRDVPPWLVERFRKDAYELQRVGSRLEPSPARPRPGEIRFARPEADERAELVVVTGVERDIVEVHYVTQDPGTATSSDVVIDREGGPLGPCAVAADLVTYVFPSQLGPVLSTVPDTVLVRLHSIAVGEASGDGPPILDRHDGRRDSKLHDLRRVRSLGSSCVALMLAAADASFEVARADQFAVAAAGDLPFVDRDDLSPLRVRLTDITHVTVLEVSAGGGELELVHFSGNPVVVLPDGALLGAGTGRIRRRVPDGVSLDRALRSLVRWPDEEPRE